MKNLKNTILLLSLLISTKAFAVTITKTGSSATTWLTTTSCWSACYNAKNRSVAAIKTAASRQCLQGYTITKQAACNWPARDPSVLVASGLWYDCSCNVSCTASFTCNQNAQFPQFAGLNKGKEIYQTNMKRSQEVANVKGELPYMTDPETVYEYMLQDHQDGLINAKNVLNDLATGKVQKLVPPSAVGLEQELDHFGTEQEKDCDEVKTIKPITLQPIKPVIIRGPLLMQ